MMFLLVHRIGRTGRCGKTGIATTFINKMCGECSSMAQQRYDVKQNLRCYEVLQYNTIVLREGVAFLICCVAAWRVCARFTQRESSYEQRWVLQRTMTESAVSQ